MVLRTPPTAAPPLANAVWCGRIANSSAQGSVRWGRLRTAQRSVGEAPHSTAFGGGGSAQHSVRWRKARRTQRSALLKSGRSGSVVATAQQSLAMNCESVSHDPITRRRGVELVVE